MYVISACWGTVYLNLSLIQEGPIKKYVGVPGMNYICRALCNEPGVDRKFGVGVGRLEWLDYKNSWSLTGSDGQYLGHFKGVVASDKNIVSPRFTNVTGRPLPLGNSTGYFLTILPLLSHTDLSLVPELAMKVKEIPVNPCFALMLAFEEPLSFVRIR
ncbi:hypothetical protein RHGRI_018839 [Rhododendron griersonianum]|uniref:Uncharacterized protein n=1 Tax=Rhododendron griersonianum TaxID=479676 RepID=A0AAV6K2Y2_9ERIC|nr:hypothetical protein RHGRI_018839 [Rhododendron griersonianum]